jgi:nicotinate-nucleotide adenylyltransferase
MDRRAPDRLQTRLPLHAPRLRVGLLGGSFNPPHAAHRAASLFALRRLGLDRIWWLVTPGNPLKDTAGLPALEQRVAAARVVADHPRIDVTDIEARFGTRYSVDTLRMLKRRYPLVRFVWLMGADNLVNFHHWRNWRAIAAMVPIAVIDRGLVGLAAFGARAPQAFARHRLPEIATPRLASRRPPAWLVLHGLKLELSSTALRAAHDPQKVDAGLRKKGHAPAKGVT